MLVVSVLLLTAWLGALILGLTLGGFVHLFAMTAILAVIIRRSPRERRRAVPAAAAFELKRR